jgi:hypothetical protein
MLLVELGDKYSGCKDLRKAAELGRKDALEVLAEIEDD